MASDSTTPELSLPINCANLSLSGPGKDGEAMSEHSENTGNTNESAIPVPTTSTAIVDNQNKRKSKVSKRFKKKNSELELENVSANEPTTNAKRRGSLVSNNPPAKLHKRKQMWETTTKAAISYFDKPRGGINLMILRQFIQDVLKAKPASQNYVFKADMYGNVKNMTVVFVSGLFQNDLNALEISNNEHLLQLERDPKTSLPFLYNKFEKLIPVKLPTNRDTLVAPMSVLLKCPLSGRQKKKRMMENKRNKLVIDDLLLTETEMRDNNYPIHSKINTSNENALPDGWKETQSFEHDGSHTFAIDCEFCDAKSGKVLTRISIVNFQNEVIYDTYVKPQEEIIDYKTKYSGITEEILEGVTTTLEEVQEKLLSLISDSDVLIGHSLESDLKVLRLRHPRVIDSSLVYEHHNGFPQKPGLKWLSEQFLDRKIQKGESNGTGHSSVEDLNACLDLIKLKLMSGPHFGRNLEGTLFDEGVGAAFESRARIIDTEVSLYNNILKDSDNVDIVKVSDDDEAVSTFDARIDDYFFNLIWLRDGRKALKAQHEDNGEGHDENSGKEGGRESLLADINNRLLQIYAALPSGSIFMICSDGGDTTEISGLQSTRREYQKQLRSGVEPADITSDVWDTDKQLRLSLAVGEARKGFALINVKD
ncbi:hypothetical protein PUMCH_004200 [Australozyma saopauloensis]|uniref:Exonuclease domain-containing protein n=1 Tax=Australozyma saopauloensis TaxID=291208 RepID=A0AAX4HE98_9ASCO|nr:hypothetical protein PUMCH_004200 [[Candida] saopauloensis]